MQNLVSPGAVIPAVHHVGSLMGHHQGPTADLDHPPRTGQVRPGFVVDTGECLGRFPAASDLRQAAPGSQDRPLLEQFRQCAEVLDYQGVLQ